MSDWYLVTQLKNFKQGVRGAHPKDMYGPQMAFHGRDPDRRTGNQRSGCLYQYVQVSGQIARRVMVR